MSQNLEGRVIVVTGAGRGIGRAIALHAAGEGAKVVVNDLGGNQAGVGSDAAPAVEVASAIRESGGAAVANTDSIATAEGAGRIIETALDSYGRIDAVVNNAGILRDRMFFNMSVDEWADVIQVHLNGYFYVARAVAPHFKKQSSGNYVHFTSPSGLIGSLGQANYAAAKMGVVGLSTGIAFDMAKYNVRSNCVAPSAWSRLIADVPVHTQEERDRNARWEQSMSADKIAPLVAFLASDASEGISGQIFKARGNEIFLMSQPRPIRSLHRAQGWTVDSLRDHFLPAMRGSFVPMQHHLKVFDWEPV